jgi:cytochrome c-type biogenesis protein CcmH
MSTNALVFWAVASLMTVAAVFVLALPWLRSRPTRSVDRETLNVAVYRDRLAELEADMTRPDLTPEQQAQEQRELERELLEDVGSSPPPPVSPNPNAGRWALLLIAVALPVVAILLYALLGTGASLLAPRETPTAAVSPPVETPPEGMPSVEQMVAKLAERLKSNPNDQHGWAMLGRSYIALGRYPEAAEAYGKAHALAAGKDAGLAADYAEAVTLANDNRMTDHAREVVAEALQQQPANPKALWLAGLGAFQEGHYQVAAEHWKRLKPLLPEGSKLADMVVSSIEEAELRATAAAPPAPATPAKP